jgi:hypothetical protein
LHMEGCPWARLPNISSSDVNFEILGIKLHFSLVKI